MMLSRPALSQRLAPGTTRAASHLPATGLARPSNRRHQPIRAIASPPGPVSNDTVPEGHQGLHNKLYGADGDAHATAGNYTLRPGEDDGSQVLPIKEWLEDREGEKPLGVFAIYDANGKVQYVSYSRNLVTAVRTAQSRVGTERAAGVRAMVFANKAMATREHMEREVVHWLEDVGPELPPGNGPERELWDGVVGASKVMSPAEAAEHEDKAAKLKLAMGEGRDKVLEGSGGAGLGGEGDEEARKRRENLKQAVEGGNWSEVIDRQTRDAVGSSPRAEASSSSSSASSSTTQQPAAASAPAAQEAGSAPAAAGGSGPAASPFAQATVHRSIGTASQDGGSAAEHKKEMTVEAVDQVLNEVRPYLMADGGDVEVVDVENGYIFLRLQGSCSTCAQSQATMKMGIERALQLAFGDQLKDVIQVDKQDVTTANVANVDMHLNMLRGAIHNFGGKVEVVEVKQGTCIVRYQGPKAIGKGVSAAIKDRFPEIKEIIMID